MPIRLPKLPTQASHCKDLTLLVGKYYGGNIHKDLDIGVEAHAMTHKGGSTAEDATGNYLAFYLPRAGSDAETEGATH